MQTLSPRFKWVILFFALGCIGLAEAVFFLNTEGTFVDHRIVGIVLLTFATLFFVRSAIMYLQMRRGKQ